MSRFGSWIAAAAALAIGACSSQDTGRISIRLTDATGPFEAAVVTITRISLQGSGGELVLSDEKTTVDLLTLANRTADLVKEAVVPIGTYSELRFQISGGYVAVADPSGGAAQIFATSPTYEGLPQGAQVAGELKMPSYAQSGLKVDVAGDGLVVKTRAKVLLVDFDVAQSFGHDAGGSGSWVMHPVIKGADITLSGNVVATLALANGVTLPKIGDHQVVLGDFGAVLTNELGSQETLPFVADPGGTFAAAFLYLLPGPYTLAVQGPNGLTFTTSPASPVAVTIVSGDQVAVPFTITSAGASAPPPAP